MGNAVPAVRVCGLLAAGLAFAVGCGSAGPRTYEVTGSVTFDGQPVEEGYITFKPADGRSAPASEKIVGGEYRLQATAGAKRIEIKGQRFIGPENAVMGARAREQYIPARYNLDSELEEEVTADGENRFDFDLKSS